MCSFFFIWIVIKHCNFYLCIKTLVSKLWNKKLVDIILFQVDGFLVDGKQNNLYNYVSTQQ